MSVTNSPAYPIDDLSAQIDPWLSHMTWRPDFERWRQQRLHQEDYQDAPLTLLRQGLALTRRAALVDPTMPDPAWLSGLQLLDLGCGMGGFAVAATCRGAHVVALDYNVAYCQITYLRSQRYQLALPIAAAAGEAIPCASASFDAITCWDVLEHVQSPERLLSELARVLRPQGVLVMTAINRYAFRDPHYHLPLINWLPRTVAEMLIRLAGRQKRGAFRDRQRLSAMHYFTWPALQRLAHCVGLRLSDLDQLRVARGDITPQRQRWRLIEACLPASWQPALRQRAYLIYRTAWQATWRVALIKV
ncbi:MAG: class I SAM-dependent methyltransferase [Chloroflexaceae bacterium]|nr:class I SAM-dependent methyltransferase [Chloroflexaceae bacterium]